MSKKVVNNENNQEKQRMVDVKFPVGRLVLIIISFLLGILDMTLLYPAVRSVFGMQNLMAMGFALMFATVANFMAYMWGYDAAKGKMKDSKLSFMAWCAIGVFYAVLRVIRIIDSVNTVENYNMTGDVLQIFVLAVLFISTGTLISSSAKEIGNVEACNARKLEKEFDEMHESLAAQSADIQQIISILENYDANYASLERQAKKVNGAIYRAEDSAMSDIVGYVLSKNKGVNPALAHKVKDEVMNRRKKVYESKEI